MVQNMKNGEWSGMFSQSVHDQNIGTIMSPSTYTAISRSHSPHRRYAIVEASSEQRLRKAKSNNIMETSTSSSCRCRMQRRTISQESLEAFDNTTITWTCLHHAEHVRKGPVSPGSHVLRFNII